MVTLGNTRIKSLTHKIETSSSKDILEKRTTVSLQEYLQVKLHDEQIGLSDHSFIRSSIYLLKVKTIDLKEHKDIRCP